MLASESPDSALAVLRDALALLRTAYTLPIITNFHRLLDSAGDLLMLLLNAFTDMSKVSSAPAMACIDDAKGVLQIFALNQSVRQALENFVVSLSLFTDDNPTVLREVQFMHNMQSSLAKGDILAPGSDSDIVTCSLILHFLVSTVHSARR